MPRKRKPIRLARLRKTVRGMSAAWGLLLDDHNAVRSMVVALHIRVQELEKKMGMRWDKAEGRYL
jgi:hypothetical protein